MDSLAGGGVGRLDRGTQLARYLSSSSSVMSLLMESAGEKSILLVLLFVQRLLCVFCFFLVWSAVVPIPREVTLLWRLDAQSCVVEGSERTCKCEYVRM